ncbi:hypothetical protein [Clostridium sp. FP1]|nr:hypothetical protein [Clostridium sp. FP1]MBZ9637737.1 hypothetical protein [Clostridium sp. FP1]
MGGIAIISVIIIISMLEIQRHFRMLNRSVKDIEELKEKVANIEALLKK